MQNDTIQTQKRLRDTKEEIPGLQVSRKGANMTRVLLVDDDCLFLECLEHALNDESGDFRIAGKIAANIDALIMVDENRPDVVIVGMPVEEDRGIETIETLCKEYPEVKVVVLSASEDGNHLVRLVKAGISAYLLRTCSVRKLAEAILAVAGGNCVLTPSIAGKLMAILQEQNQHVKKQVVFSLSKREKEVLHYAAIGTSNKETARKCHIRENTVKTHFRNIMRKMHARNRAEAVALATSMRILPRISREEIQIYA